MKSIQLIITGQVQGVGFRDWLVAEASRLGLTGWVCNAEHNTVHAVVSGDEDAVALCLEACRRGPPGARVKSITTTQTAPPESAKFIRLASLP